MAQPGWDLYRSYLAVMRTGSLSGAARQIGLAQPTVGRHVQELEASLGAALFTRSPQGLSPTELGSALLAHAEAMESAAAAIVRAASAGPEDVAGTVRITTSEIVGAEVAPAMLARLKARHPGLVFELVLSNSTQDLLRRDADVAVRMVEPKQAALVARKVGRLELGIYARDDYLARCGTPTTLDDLRRLALIGFDRQTVGAGSLHAADGQVLELDRALFDFRSDSDVAQLSALRAGFGAGVCQVPLARRDTRLVRLMADQLAFHLDVWVVMHEDLRATRRVRTVFDHLVEAFSTYLEE